MPIPGASWRAEHVRPVLDHASRDPPLRADRPRNMPSRSALPGNSVDVARRTEADPPFPLIEYCRITLAQRPQRRRLPGEGGRCSLGALLRNTCEQGTNLGLPVAPVSPQRAD